MPYCTPRDTSAAGIKEICRRVAGLLRCLENEVSSAVAHGEITQDLQRFRIEVLQRLENEGWSFSYNAGPRLQARQPGHPHPFTRLTDGT